MKLWMIKFTHGVEVGARLAYLGHFRRTQKLEVLRISEDEYNHQLLLKHILKELGTKPSFFIDLGFSIVGNIIKYLCLISPEVLLNKVATILEKFAVFSYDRLAIEFPQYADTFHDMEALEQEHVEYFQCR